MHDTHEGFREKQEKIQWYNNNNSVVLLDSTLWKRDSSKDVSLWIWWIFQEHLFCRTTPDTCFWWISLFYPERNIDHVINLYEGR